MRQRDFGTADILGPPVRADVIRTDMTQSLENDVMSLIIIGW